jgi:CDP-diacylglycerol--glycerol-3-phosphate 3-phosphatidyltransferase
MNIPTFFTLLRLIVSPILLPFLLVYFLPLNKYGINAVLAGLFLFFSITDLLDGYLARRLGKVTQLGAMLDPIADKFLMYSTLVALLAVHKIFFLWVLILIGREFFVTGLRLIAYEHGIKVNVSWRGKLKTVVQTLYLAVVIASPYHALGSTRFNQLEHSLLGLTLLLSLWSAYRYYQAVEKILKPHFSQVDTEGE